MARSNVLLVAVIVSTLFHLSMVSVFSIVIRFPAAGIRYVALDIVERPAQQPAPSASPDALRAPSLQSLIAEAQTTTAEPDAISKALDSVPVVELPKLRLSGKDMLRTPAESLRIRSRLPGLFDARQPEIPDSWALFTRELRQIVPSLSRTFSGEVTQEQPAQRINTSVPGIGVYVEWMSEPKQRKVLLAPPMQTLLSIDPGTLDEPIEIVFSVDAQGKVVEANAPAVGENAEAIESIRRVLMTYVFEPEETPAAQNQRGTLVVKAEQAEP